MLMWLLLKHNIIIIMKLLIVHNLLIIYYLLIVIMKFKNRNFKLFMR